MKENWEIHWKDYFKILQIHPLAEPEVIKAAYQKLAMKYHSDIHQGQGDGKMKDLNEAFEIISNPDKRQRYYIAYEQTCRTPTQSTNYTYRYTQRSTQNPPQYSTPNPTTHPDITELLLCRKCEKITDMKIGFLNKVKAFATCPVCHSTYDLRVNMKHPTNTNTNEVKDKPDVKKRLDEFMRRNKRF
jgi:curved DNA-binding protein CbpA